MGGVLRKISPKVFGEEMQKKTPPKEVPLFYPTLNK